MEIIETRVYMQVVVYTLAVMAVVIADCFLYLRTKHIMLVQYFFRIQALVGVWMIAIIFRAISTTHQGMVFWVNVEYLGVCFFGVEMLVFGYLYKYNKPFPVRLHQILIGISMFNYFMLFTNEFHHLFFGALLVSHSPKGIFFYVHMSFSYIVIVISIFFLVTSKVNKSFDKNDGVAILVGLLVPFTINVAYVFNVDMIPFDLTPITYNMMIISFAFVAFRQNYYDMQMMTRYTILENLYEGVIILDQDNRIIEYNNKAAEIARDITKIKKYSKFETIFSAFEAYVESFEEVVVVYNSYIDSALSHAKVEVHVEGEERDDYYVITFQKLFDKFGNYSGNIIKFIDISEYHKLMIELEEKNITLQDINGTLNENISVKKRLVVEQERNRVSKELHDILGHSVTIVISLLEMVRQTFEKKPDIAKEKVNQAMDITRSGLAQLKKTIVTKRETTINTETLIEDIETLSDEFKVSGVEVEFITNHYPIEISPKYYDTVYRVCQESMTNALRHGQASKITIAVRFSEHSVDIIIADNGIGCSDFTKGNGIKGMEQRVQELDGFFSCGSPDGEGFNLHVTIPIVMTKVSINESEPSKAMTSE